MTAKTQLLLHSDHLLIRTGLNAVLAGERDIEVVGQTTHGAELLDQISQFRPQLLLMGVTTDDSAIEHLIRQVQSLEPETSILVVGLDNISQHITAGLRVGVDHFTSRCSTDQQLVNAVRQAANTLNAGVVDDSSPDMPEVSVGQLISTHQVTRQEHSASTTSSAFESLDSLDAQQDLQKPESQRMLAPLAWAMDKLANELNFLTAHDALTGLVNRREFERRLKGAVQDGKITGTEHSLLYFDIDQFKVINDTCGHVAGDEYLRQVGDLLSQHTRASDTLARLGGDEFALLLYGCATEPAVRMAEQLRQVIAALEFEWQGRKFGGSLSAGVVTFAENTQGSEQVLGIADSACSLAKEKGRNRVHVYRSDDAELSVRLQEMRWVSRLREALEQQRLTLYAQDIVPIAKPANKHTRLEILVRLKEADGTIVPPIAFIPAAERYNLMPAVDRFVINAAFSHLAALEEHQQRVTSYSINVSGATLNDEAFPVFVEQQLTEHGLSASQICFEITETTAIANLLQVADVIRALKLLGFQFALDDFGRGMSSLAYLKHLPVDFLKIDGEFIKGILDDEIDGAMVRAICSIAHTMGIKTVAEFVENNAVLKLLEGLGVDFVQGYGIHKPEPLGDRLPAVAHHSL